MATLLSPIAMSNAPSPGVSPPPGRYSDQRYRAALSEELEQRERQQLDRLSAKYEDVIH